MFVAFNLAGNRRSQAGIERDPDFLWIGEASLSSGPLTGIERKACLDLRAPEQIARGAWPLFSKAAGFVSVKSIGERSAPRTTSRNN